MSAEKSPVAEAPIVQKPWGQVAHLVGGSSREHLDQLEIRAGGQCSRHLHRHKINEFRVTRGVLTVTLFDAGGQRVLSHHPLHPASPPFVVPPGQVHQFHALEACACLEIYYLPGYRSAPDPDDIVRLG